VCELVQVQQDQAQCRNQEVTPTVATSAGHCFNINSGGYFLENRAESY